MYVPIYFSKNTKYKIFGGKQGKFLGRGEREGRLSFTLSGFFFFSLRGASRLLYRVYVSVRIESWFEFYSANPNVFGDLYLFFFVSNTEEKYIRIILTRIFSVNAPYCRIYWEEFCAKT